MNNQIKNKNKNSIIIISIFNLFKNKDNNNK